MVDVYPIVRYADARAGIDWLVKVLGFREVAVHEQDGRVVHAEFAFGDGCIMTGEKTDSDYARAVGQLGPAELYLATDDIHGHYERVVAAGAKVVRPLVENPGEGWGYTVLDPEGNAWSVGEYRAAL